MTNLTSDEKNALRYYIGDVSGNDEFYGDTKAYVTLNSLFFSNIHTEKARTDEGKLVNPAVIADIPRLIGFFESLFLAFAKASLDEVTEVYRVERMSDFLLCRQKSATISLTSTSTAGFLNYYRDRRGIALLKFELPVGTNCINIANALDNYSKPEEAEILLPPFMRIDITEKPLSNSELQITDIDGMPPKISCNILPVGITPCNEKIPELPHGGELAGKKVYAALNSHINPNENDIALYSEWKRTLQIRLHKLINDIFSSNTNPRNIDR